MRIKSGLACAAHAAAEHLLLSIATKVGKNAFAAESRRLAKTESYYQRSVGFLLNALRRQLGSFIYHRQRVNALLLTIFFLLPSVWLCLRSPIHVGSAEGYFYHQQSVNAVLLSLSFPLPTWAAVGELVLWSSLVLSAKLSVI